jgi:penicillin-binding protein A
MAKRIRYFGLAMIVLFCALLLQLDNIQGIKANQYQHAADNPVTLEDEFTEPRGRIITADGVIVANSVLAPPNDYYKYQRVYPTGPLFAQIVGFTSYNYGTYTGVEAQYNSDLAYHTQPPRTLSDLFDSEQGTDQVVLTVSDKLQTLAQQALGKNDGAVVVLNPSSGAVLAMYANPSFNPSSLAAPSLDEEEAGWNAYNAKDAEGFINGQPLSYDRQFFPGSTFKVITTAAAYDHDPSLTTMAFPYGLTYTPPGTNLAIHNDNGAACGGTIQLMLPQSCDTGYAHLGVDLGAQSLVSEANAFGFGTLGSAIPPPIDLPTGPGSVSTIPSALSFEQGQDALLAYSAIGQDNVLATPLEMALVASGIADDGVIMTPHVMARVLDPDDNVIDTYNAKPWITATSAKTAQSVTSLMEGVVTSGTAKGIFPSSWDVAAKTGTAQAGTGNSVTDDWMIAFAPANHPEVAIAVLVPNQVLNASGASVSGPIVEKVLSGIPGLGGSS